MASRRALLSGSAPDVAPMLLGWRLSRRTPAGRVTIELTEVEAYAGEDDPASHAGRGRTARSEVMYGPPGRLYVYFSYGMHWCANVVCGPDGHAAAVLLRSGRVVEGVDLARDRRRPTTPESALARGPACLTQALGIGREHNGLDLVSSRPGSPGDRTTPPELRLSGPTTPGAHVPVRSGPRVGVTLAADRPWRFWVDGDSSVSAYRRSPRSPQT